MEVVGVDLGFGWVKACSGDRAIRFPAVVGEGRQLFEREVGNADPLDCLVHHSGQFVGNLAIRQSNTKTYSLSEDRASHKVAGVLLDVAIEQLQVGVCGVVTGLPIGWYWGQRDGMERLAMAHPAVAQVKIVPQPLGSFMSWLLDDDGQVRHDRARYASGTVGIVDVGMHTADYLLLQGMEVSQPYSHTTRSGLHVALRTVGSGLPLYEADQAVLSGSIDAREALQGLARQVRGEIESFWPDTDMVLVTGGGGAMLYDYLGVGILADDPGMANVEGYGKLGRRSWDADRVSIAGEGPGTDRGRAKDRTRGAVGSHQGGTTQAPSQLRWAVPSDEGRA